MVEINFKNTLLFLIVITGAVGLIGTVAVSARLVNPYVKWGGYVLQSSQGDDAKSASIIGLVFPLFFGVVTFFLWIITINTCNTKNKGVGKATGMVTLICCFLCFLGPCITHGLLCKPNKAVYDEDYTDPFLKDFSQEKADEYEKWVADKYKTEEHQIEYTNSTYKIFLESQYNYGIFLCFSGIFLALSFIYWLNEIFFESINDA